MNFDDTDPERQRLLQDPIAIQQREEDIGYIAAGVRDINDIMKDIGSIVVEQGGLLDHIGANIDQTAVHLNNADDELIRANTSQQKRKRCLCWIFSILAITVIILLIILLIKVHPWDLK